LSCFLVSFSAGAAEVISDMILKCWRLFGGDKLFGGSDDFEDTEADAFDLVGGLDFPVAGFSAEESCKLSVSVKGGVVHFGDKDVIVVFKDCFEIIWKWVDVADVDCADLVAFGIHAISSFFDRAIGGAPADDKKVARFFTMHRGWAVAFGELNELFATLHGHLRVVFRIARWVTPFVVLKTGDNRILTFCGASAGRGVAGDLIERVRFKIFTTLGEIEFWRIPMLREIRFFKGFETSGDCLIGENENWGGIFLCDSASLHCGVEAVFDISWSEDDARCVTMRAVDCLHEVGLLYRSWEAGGRSTTLDIHYD